MRRERERCRSCKRGARKGFKIKCVCVYVSHQKKKKKMLERRDGGEMSGDISEKDEKLDEVQ